MQKTGVTTQELF